MKYELIQMPDGAIDIVDNHDSIGKSWVYRLIDEGGKPVGTINSNLRPGALMAGFEHCETKSGWRGKRWTVISNGSRYTRKNRKEVKPHENP